METKKYKLIKAGLLTVMVICVVNLIINATALIVRTEMKKEQECIIAEMQVQTDILLYLNGFEWDGTRVVKIQK